MDSALLIDTPLFQWILLPLLIFIARAADVSISTVRIILLSKGKKKLAPVLGFFEILIWLLAIRQVFLNLTNPLCYIAYAGGFAVGTFVGMIIEEKLAIGYEVIRVITKQDAGELIEHLHKKGFGVTSMPAQGATGLVHVIFAVVKRSNVMNVLSIIKKFNPKAFYTIESIRSVREGIFPSVAAIKQ